MIGVKITVMLLVLTFIWDVIATQLLKNNIKDWFNFEYRNEPPWYCYVLLFLCVLDVIGVIYSVAYLLFFM